MALIEYTPQYFKDQKAKALLKRELEIRVYKTGKVSLSYGLAQHLGLKAGDTVTIAQDDQNPMDWYIYPDPAGFALVQWSTGQGYEIRSMPLVKLFQDCFPDTDLTFPVAKVPVEVDGIHGHAILTAKQAEAKRIHDLTTPKAKTA